MKIRLQEAEAERGGARRAVAAASHPGVGWAADRRAAGCADQDRWATEQGRSEQGGSEQGKSEQGGSEQGRSEQGGPVRQDNVPWLCSAWDGAACGAAGGNEPDWWVPWRVCKAESDLQQGSTKPLGGCWSRACWEWARACGCLEGRRTCASPSGCPVLHLSGVAPAALNACRPGPAERGPASGQLGQRQPAWFPLVD